MEKLMEELMEENNVREKKNYVRICGMWKNYQVMSSNNLRKRLNRNKPQDDTQDDTQDPMRLTLMTNQYKKDNSFMSNDAEAHLLVEAKHLDDLIDYLQLVKEDYHERMGNN